MAKYNAFVAVIENEITKDQDVIVFGEHTSVKTILDVFDEEAEDMRPCHVKGFTFIKSDTKKGMDRLIKNVTDAIDCKDL